MPRPLGIAVDLENLRDGVGGVLALLRELDSEDAVVHFVGGRWAQALAPNHRIPGDWIVRRQVNTGDAEAADAVIHELLDRWRRESRVAVVISSDGGFAVSLAAHRRSGVPAFLVTTGRPARRLRAAAPVHLLTDAAAVRVAAGVIEGAR